MNAKWALVRTVLEALAFAVAVSPVAFGHHSFAAAYFKERSVTVEGSILERLAADYDVRFPLPPNPVRSAGCRLATSFQACSKRAGSIGSCSSPITCSISTPRARPLTR
jgi:hypothetical protein